MSHQTMLQLQAKTDSRLTDISGIAFSIPRGTTMLLGLMHDHDRILIKVVTGDAMSHKLRVAATDLDYRHELNVITIEGAEFPVLSDKPTRLGFEQLLGYVKFHERLMRQVSYNQVL